MKNELYDTLFAPHRESSAPFLYMKDKTLSYQAFLDLAAQIAGVLVDNGATSGDRIAAQVAKTPEALALYVASVQIGAVFLPLNPAYTPVELEYFIKDAEPRLLVCDPKSVTVLAPIARSVGGDILTLDEKGQGSLSGQATSKPVHFETIARGKDDLAAILYTSGTTGRSKGTMLSHENLLSNAEVLTKAWQFTAKDILLHALPVFHTHGLFVATNTVVCAGASMVFQPRFSTKAIIEALPSVTSMMGVPTFYTRLLDDAGFTKGLVDHMRLFISGSAPLLAETHADFFAKTGHRILERYGMTETNMNTSNPYDGNRKEGTVGPPLPGITIRITDPVSGAELPTGDVGDIAVKGPNVFTGYWRMPEKTAEEFTQDGFFITGDLGMVDEDGYIHIVGRAKDLIITGGQNVYPKEVELILDQVSGVLESAVIGVKHPDFGEGVVAVMVFNNKPVEVTRFQQAVTQSLATFKHPKRYFTVKELPRNAMGKVQKNILREQFASCFGNIGADA